MNRAGVMILGGFVAVMSTAASAQTQTQATAETNRQIGASTNPVAHETGESPPLFKIGGLAVRVWTPVERDYNAAADSNLAADPLWGPNW
jgi:hypothetical protein